MNNFYVYIYLDPRKPGDYRYNGCRFRYEPFYIGKGKGKRYLAHLKNCQRKKRINERNNMFKINKINKILKEGYDLEKYILIIPCNSEKDAFDFEMKLINNIGRKKNDGPLTNLTDGGTGKSGSTQSKEARRKISESLIGHIVTEEQKRKISKSKKGRKLTEEHKQKIENSKNFKNECKWCHNIFNTKVHNKQFCNDCCKKIDIIIKKTQDLRDKNGNDKIARALKGKKKSEEHRRKISNINKGKRYPNRKYINKCKNCNCDFEAKSNAKKYCKKCEVICQK